MVRKKALLYLEEIHCVKDSGDGGGDDIFLMVYGDGKKLGRWPTGNSEWTMNSSETDRIDLEIECTYYDEISIDIWEADSDNNNNTPTEKDDFQGTAYIQRKDPLPSNNKDTRRVDSPTGDAVYEISFRVISDPIPTVRVLGIRCEQDSDGMDGGVVNAIANVAIACTEAAGEVLKKSPRPSRELMGDAMLASSKVMKAKQEIVGWLKDAIEGADDVYIKHVANTSTRGEGGAFFPPGDPDTYGMKSGDEVHFEKEYDHYFRFPLDEGEVRIEFREKDAIGTDIIIGSIIIDPEQIKENDPEGTGISGGSPEYTEEEVTSIPGGMAVYDGPAVVEVANSYYGRQGGAGAIYYICYSVGTENWLLPATTEGQGDINDGVLPESANGYYTAPRGPVNYSDAQAGCQGQEGVLPTVEELDLLISSGWIPESWPKGNYWLAENFYMDIETKFFNSTMGDTDPPECYYCCKQSDKGNGVEGWDGDYGFTFSAPKGMVGYDTANASTTSQGGELPTAEALQHLAQNAMIPANWPAGSYWITGQSFINLPEGGQSQSADGNTPCYYTSQILTFEEDKVMPWEGIGGYYVFPRGPVNYNEAVSGSQFVGGELPTLAHFQILIDQEMIPASWPKDKYYWTADKHWVNITDIHDSGASGDGTQSYYYASFIPGVPDEVETVDSFETEDRYFASPMGPVALDEAKQICQTRGGELSTLETLRLMVEQNLIPENWPKDKYYYTDNGYMVDISALEGKDMIIKSEDGDHSCYFSCEIKKESYDPVAHGAFGPPQYLVDFAYAQADCAAQGASIPSLEDMLSLIRSGHIPDSWLKGYYWATVSPNTLICVHSKTGEYWYSETGKEQCFYSCHKAEESDGIEEWKPGEGLYLHPETLATFSEAQTACEAQGGTLPNLEEMQLILQQFKEGTIPNTWPVGEDINYYTSDRKLVKSTDYQTVMNDNEGKNHFTCKTTGAFNGIMTGYEIREGHYLYTQPLKKQTYKDAIDTCLWYGGEMATMEDIGYLNDNGKIPSVWPGGTNVWYMTRDGYYVTPKSDLWNVEWDYDPNISNIDIEYYFTCKIKEEGYEEKVTGHFSSPLEIRAGDAWDDCEAKGGAIPSLTEMLFLIENGLIPDNWPVDYLYHAGTNGGAFTVNIETGEYHFVGNPDYNEKYYYSCKTPSEELQVERFAGIDAFYSFPAGKPADYSKAEDACKMNGGQLPTVASLRNLIKHGNIPATWPVGNYWLNGGYYMDITTGGFRHSLDGSESCYYSCSILDWAQTVAKGDEVAYGGNVFLSPQGPNAWSPAEAYTRVDNGNLPAEAELKSVIDAGVIPESWPSGNYYYNSKEDWVDISNSANSGYSAETAYHTTRVSNPNGYKLILDIEESS